MTEAERLAEAEAAYHALMTGRMARVYADQNGERVEYTRATAANLAAYIDRLRSRLGAVAWRPLRPWL